MVVVVVVVVMAVAVAVVVVKVADFIMIIQSLQACPTHFSEIMNGRFVRNQQIYKILKLFSVDKVDFLGCDSWAIREFRIKFSNTFTIYIYGGSGLKSFCYEIHGK